mmetsp:Transcript_28650/g.27652  ORF Transcript_28650/g.27652 Transcript_28650/m.27652 type:complete len:106 (-) Transcript_28650:936-1253(-)
MTSLLNLFKGQEIKLDLKETYSNQIALFLLKLLDQFEDEAHLFFTGEKQGLEGKNNGEFIPLQLAIYFLQSYPTNEVMQDLVQLIFRLRNAEVQDHLIQSELLIY